MRTTKKGQTPVRVSAADTSKPDSTKRFHFTERAIRAIEPPAEKRIGYRDTAVKELGVLCQVSGHKSFFWFRKVRGRPTWKTIGSIEDVPLDDARDQARAWSVAAAAWKRDHCR